MGWTSAQYSQQSHEHTLTHQEMI